MTATVTTDATDHVCTITFSDPETRNALSRDLLADLRDAIDEVEATDDCRVLVLRSEPADGIFCSGYDIDEFTDGRSPDETERHFAETIHRLRAFDYPVIASIDGDVWGGGVELIATCDLRVAADDVQFGVTPAKLGILYPARGIQRFLHLLGPANTGELLYTASGVSAERAQDMGLLNRVVEAAAVDNETAELATDVARNAPLSLSGMKQTIRAFLDTTSLSPTEEEYVRSLRTEAYESRDHAEAKAAFAEGRDPEFEGH